MFLHIFLPLGMVLLYPVKGFESLKIAYFPALIMRAHLHVTDRLFGHISFACQDSFGTSFERSTGCVPISLTPQSAAHLLGHRMLVDGHNIMGLP